MLVPLYIRIEEDLHKKLKQVAENERRSMASLAQVLLKQSVENPEPKRRKTAVNDVNDAVERMLGQ